MLISSSLIQAKLSLFYLCIAKLVFKCKVYLHYYSKIDVVLNCLFSGADKQCFFINKRNKKSNKKIQHKSGAETRERKH
jgi:hypothetical protein